MNNLLQTALLILIAALTPTAKANPLPKTEKLLPTETILLVNAADFTKLKGQFQQTNLYKLYKDPAMAEFIDDAKEKWLNKIKQKQNKILTTIFEDKILPQGRISFALVHNKKAEKESEPMAFFLIQWGGEIDKIKLAADETVNKLIDKGAHKKQERFRDVEINTIIAAGERFGYGFSSPIHYCFIEDFLLGSEDIELLKFAIAHSQGAASPTLADQTNYHNCLEQITTFPDINLYLNLKEIYKILLRQRPDSKTAIESLGLDNLASLSGSVGIARGPQYTWQGNALLRINGEKKGICKMLEPESATFEPPAFIPSSFSSVSFWNLDINKAFNELTNILTSFSPQYASLLFTPIPLPPSAGRTTLELKKDFISHLGSQIVFASGVEENADASQPARTETLVAFSAANPQLLEKSLSLLHSNIIAPNNADAKRQLLGHTIYLIDLPAIPFLPMGKTPMATPENVTPLQFPKFAFTVTDTHFIFSTENVIEKAIRTINSSDDTSISSTKWLRDALSALPSVAGFSGVENTRTAMQTFWAMMKKSAEIAKNKDENAMKLGMTSTAGTFPKMMFSQDLFDTSKLPEFEKVKKYFGIFVDYIISQPEGYFGKFKILKPTTP